MRCGDHFIAVDKFETPPNADSVICSVCKIGNVRNRFNERLENQGTAEPQYMSCWNNDEERQEFNHIILHPCSSHFLRHVAVHIYDFQEIDRWVKSDEPRAHSQASKTLPEKTG
jgi:hypothetical protein